MLECHFQSETKIEPDLRLQRIQLSHNKFINGILGVRLTWLDVKANCSAKGKACFKRHATAVPNSKPTPNFECLAAKHVMFAPNCPPECYLQSETKLEPDLRLHKWRFVLNSVTEMPMP